MGFFFNWLAVAGLRVLANDDEEDSAFNTTTSSQLISVEKLLSSQSDVCNRDMNKTKLSIFCSWVMCVVLSDSCVTSKF